MKDLFSLDHDYLADRKSTFLIRVKGKKKRLNLQGGDLLIVDKNLPLKKDHLGLLVVEGKFKIDLVSEEFIQRHDPESGDFVWGMVKTVVRELA